MLLEFRALKALQRAAEELRANFAQHRPSVTGSVSKADTDAAVPAFPPPGAVEASGINGEQGSPMRGMWPWRAARGDSEPPGLQQLEQRICQQEERIRALQTSCSHEGGPSPAVCAFVVSLPYLM